MSAAGALPHQASCVAIDGRGVLIEGPPGSGKSSLALALIDRGATLVGDDGVLLEVRDGRLWALPPPHIRGLLEIRHVGIVTLPAAEARVALVIALADDAPRLPEAPESVVRAGLAIPAITLPGHDPVLHLRAEQSLLVHGLA